MNIDDFIVPYKDQRLWRKIIIHHSVSADNKMRNWLDILKYHIEVRGWKDIGYHFGIEYIQDSLEYQVGRSLLDSGAHTIGENETGIGVCVVGNYDLAQPSHHQYSMLASLCRKLMTNFSIKIENVLPHWAFANKSCPGKNFSILKLRDYILWGSDETT